MESADQVVTVSAAGVVTGQADRVAAHRPPGTLHLAVSVQLVDPTGSWLLQRRASGKPLFAGHWANSCCTHPRPGEALEAAVRRRVREELGVGIDELVPAGRFRYRATDTVSGLVEHELDHVFVGVVDGRIEADPDEVDDVVSLPLDQAYDVLTGSDGAPWAATVLRQAAERWPSQPRER